jgi:SH3-like domain-containing protein
MTHSFAPRRLVKCFRYIVSAPAAALANLITAMGVSSGILALLPPVLLLSALCGCNTEKPETRQYAYVAPQSVNLRSQLNQKNSTVAVLKHGERVIVLDVRRRYVRLRTSKGEEGWLDSLDLLSPTDMQRIQRERERALALPSEGAATAYETANIHLEPNRQSPAFAQIPEGGSVSILGRKITPRAGTAPRPSIVLEKPRPALRRPRKERQNRTNLRPPKPPRPGPPANWQELWGVDRDDGENAPADKPLPVGPARRAKSGVLDAWNLIRTKNNQVGWVLSRNLMMSIPDEVAQYAEGKHITSYFELGVVNDEKQGPKRNWLWTTASEGQSPDFDSWRVFLWNRRRHRYETSYRQRDLEGYFPVHVDPPDPAVPGRTFQLITRDDDGKFRRRNYRFDGTRVHLIGTEDYDFGRSGTTGEDSAKQSVQVRKPPSGWLQRQWAALKKKFSARN